MSDNTEITDAWFAVYGANLNLDDDGNVESVTDAGSLIKTYLEGCEELGVKNPPVIGL